MLKHKFLPKSCSGKRKHGSQSLNQYPPFPMPLTVVSSTSPLHSCTVSLPCDVLVDGPAASMVVLLALPLAILFPKSILVLLVLAFRIILLEKSVTAGCVRSDKSFNMCNRRSIDGTYVQYEFYFARLYCLKALPSKGLFHNHVILLINIKKLIIEVLGF